MIVISAQAFPPKSGGIQDLIAGLAEHISKAGHTVKVLADGNAEACAYDKEHHTPYSVERFSGLKFIRRRHKAARLNKLAETEQVQALYADSWKSLEFIARDLDFPVVVWAHGNEFPDDGRKKERIQDALAKADHVLFISRSTEERAQPFMPKDVISSVMHPPIPEPEEVSADHRLEAETIWANCNPKLFSMARLVPLKGHDQVIRSMPEVLKHFPNARYVIAGIGDDLSRLQDLAADLNVAHAIQFIGWVKGGLKSALLEQADIFLQPGRKVGPEREGYGISYVEAAFHGVPSICGSAGGASEAVIDAQSGLVVDAEDDQNVCDAILHLLKNKQRHQAMRTTARAHGQNCLWDKQIDRILQPAGLKIGEVNG